MRIAIITNTLPSLSETFILDQITGLLDMGQEVVILAGERSNELKVHADVEGVPHAVDKGKSALLVPPRDANALADRLQFLIDNLEICGQMGKCGRQYVEEN